MVGYREGHVRIPSVPTRIVLEPSASTEDDTARIQAALDQVAQLPLEDVGPHGAAVRGAVLLRAGVYRVAGALILNASGVVLRGEGQDENGTIVVATGVIQRDFILVNGQLTSDMGSIEMQQAKARTKEMMPSNWYRGSKKTTTTRSGVYIPVGENRIPVEDVGPFKTGNRVVASDPPLFFSLCSLLQTAGPICTTTIPQTNNGRFGEHSDSHDKNLTSAIKVHRFSPRPSIFFSRLSLQ